MNNTGASTLSTVLGIGALVLTAGFLFWLNQRSRSLEDEVRPAMEDTAGETEMPATLADLREDVAAVVGREGELDSATVAASLGRGVFNVELDSARAYPILLSTQLMQRDQRLYGGDLVFVHGRFFTLNDSIRSRWVETGAVDSTSAGNLPSTPSFLLADSLRVY